MPQPSLLFLSFLYQCLRSQPPHTRKLLRSAIRHLSSTQPAAQDGATAAGRTASAPPYVAYPTDYGRNLFVDKCKLTIEAGAGGHGCVSFLRDRWIADGPPNGGDGGTGGNVYIQAVSGATSLHKVAQRRFVRAGRGRNGTGSSRGGQRGADVLLEVPVGTVVRELGRLDPVQVEEDERSAAPQADGTNTWARRDEWLLHPGAMPAAYSRAAFSALPRPRRSNLAVVQPPAPIALDLSAPSAEPRLLAAGAVGGLGNPHFATKSLPRPVWATRGDRGLRLELELELKLLADLALVGAPNAGKSTLLRALSRARARVGHWAFTTLAPNVGTVVLDDGHGRGRFETAVWRDAAGGATGDGGTNGNGGASGDLDGGRRTRFTVADVPGLVADAHLDKGLGLEFLRHVERARALAFVLDLSDPAVAPAAQLASLWRELDQFTRLQEQRLHARTERRVEAWETFGGNAGGATATAALDGRPDEPVREPIAAKPWFVVATKADVEGTRERFEELRAYLAAVGRGEAPHPSGAAQHAWRGPLVAVPVSAMRGEGADGVVRQAAQLLARA